MLLCGQATGPFLILLAFLFYLVKLDGPSTKAWLLFPTQALLYPPPFWCGWLQLGISGCGVCVPSPPTPRLTTGFSCTGASFVAPASDCQSELQPSIWCPASIACHVEALLGSSATGRYRVYQPHISLPDKKLSQDYLSVLKNY